jgi:hypothetical protein
LAVNQAPENQEAKYHLAVALAEQGNVGRARALISEALNSGIPFASEDEAKEFADNL